MINNNKIRLRFAPSPTGYLHIGGLRTAFFDYLIAKSLGGDLILRIEDTDQKRFVPGSIEKLYEILEWAGIEFDEGPGGILNESATDTPRPDLTSGHPSQEGIRPILSNQDVGDYGPYIQSERQEIYKKYIEELLGKGEAYYCFCSAARLEKMREDQQARKMAPRYDRACREIPLDEAKKRIAAGEKYVIRQKMPLEGEVAVVDELRGEIKFKAADLEDHVLIKSDGTPTYQFACIVDDHLMKISHVVRGDEWLPSYPKNALLYKSFGWEQPKFIHLPLVLNKEGGKLSKRQGDVAVEDFRAKGYLREALLNFVALLGWSPYAKASRDEAPQDKKMEIFLPEEAINVFNYKDISVSPAIFDTAKLDYLNGIYIRKKTIDEMLELCRPYLAENISLASNEYKKTDEFIKKAITLEQERLVKLSEIGELTKFLFQDNLEYEPDLLVWKKSDLAGAKACLAELVEVLEKIDDKIFSDKKALEENIIGYLKANNKPNGDYLWPMRAALSGQKASPGPFEIAAVLGQTETIEKIKKAINKL